MKKETYTYPAIFNYEEENIFITFPDLEGCSTFAETEEQAIEYAKEILSLYIDGCDEETLPKPSSVRNIKAKKNEVIVLIEVWMPYYRASIKEYSVKKTLTIPGWLNVVAEQNKINFSKLLQDSLKEILCVEEPKAKYAVNKKDELHKN